MKRTLVGLAIVALATAPGALGKGAAVSGSPPADPDVGETWSATVRLDPPDLALHDDVAPAVVLRGPDGEMRVFRADPTGTEGVYEAAVTFPRAGRWSYAATIAPHIALSELHLVPLNVGSRSDDGSLPSVPAAAGLAALTVTLVVAGIVAVRRRRSFVPSRA